MQNYRAIGVLVLLTVLGWTRAEHCSVNITQEVREHLKSGSTIFDVIIKNESPTHSLVELLLVPYTPFAQVEGMDIDVHGLSIPDTIPPLGKYRWSYTLYGPREAKMDIAIINCENPENLKDLGAKIKRDNLELMSDEAGEGNEAYDHQVHPYEGSDYDSESEKNHASNTYDDATQHASDQVDELAGAVDDAQEAASDELDDPFGVFWKRKQEQDSHKDGDNDKQHDGGHKGHYEPDSESLDNEIVPRNDDSSGLPPNYDPADDPEVNPHPDTNEDELVAHHEELVAKHHGPGGKDHSDENEPEGDRHHHDSQDSDSDDGYHHHDHRPKDHGESHDEGSIDDEVFKHPNHGSDEARDDPLAPRSTLLPKPSPNPRPTNRPPEHPVPEPGEPIPL